MAAPVKAVAESVTTSIRRVLLQNKNEAMRLTALFEQVRPQHPEMTKTHFRARVVRQMFSRGELIKYLITEEVRGKERKVYGLRLKNNRDNRQRAEDLGLLLPKGGWGSLKKHSPEVSVTLVDRSKASDSGTTAAASELR